MMPPGRTIGVTHMRVAFLARGAVCALVALAVPAAAHAATPLAPALDGNTVDTQLEQAAFAENAVRYQATLTMLNNKFRTLLTAIMGS